MNKVECLGGRVITFVQGEFQPFVVVRKFHAGEVIRAGGTRGFDFYKDMEFEFDGELVKFEDTAFSVGRHFASTFKAGWVCHAEDGVDSIDDEDDAVRFASDWNPEAHPQTKMRWLREVGSVSLLGEIRDRDPKFRKYVDERILELKDPEVLEETSPEKVDDFLNINFGFDMKEMRANRKRKRR